MSDYIDDCIGGSVQMMVYGWTDGMDIGDKRLNIIILINYVKCINCVFAFYL
jgi:hypothetical protein